MTCSRHNKRSEQRRLRRRLVKRAAVACGFGLILFALVVAADVLNVL